MLISGAAKSSSVPIPCFPAWSSSTENSGESRRACSTDNSDHWDDTLRRQRRELSLGHGAAFVNQRDHPSESIPTVLEHVRARTERADHEQTAHITLGVEKHEQPHERHPNSVNPRRRPRHNRSSIVRGARHPSSNALDEAILAILKQLIERTPRYPGPSHDMRHRYVARPSRGALFDHRSEDARTLNLVHALAAGVWRCYAIPARTGRRPQNRRRLLPRLHLISSCGCEHWFSCSSSLASLPCSLAQPKSR